MDFRMRNFKENKSNYNSTVEFPKNIDLSRNDSLEYLPIVKMKQQSSQFNQIYEMLKRQKEQKDLAMNHLQQRIELVEYKISTVERENRHPIKNDTFMENRSLIHNNNSSHDISLLKQTIFADLTNQREEIRAQNNKFQQISMNQSRLQQELRQWISQEKQEVNLKFRSQNQELKGAEFSKQKKYEYMQESLKQTIHNLESKFESQNEKRNKNESSLRQLLAKQIANLKQELIFDKKGEKQHNNTFFKELKNSFTSLKQVITKDRQYVKQAIHDVQTSTQSTTNKIAKTLESVNAQLIDKHDKLESKFASFKEEWGGFKVMTGQQLEEYKAIVMNIENNSLDQREQVEKNNSSINQQTLQELKQELNQWKKLTEQKNLNVFRQISNAMKILRIQWRKQHDSLVKEYEEIGKSMKNLKQITGNKIQKQIHSVVALLNEQFDTLTAEMEKFNEMLAKSKKEVDQKINDQIGKELISLRGTLQNKLAQSNKDLQMTVKRLQNNQLEIKKSVENNIQLLKEHIHIIDKTLQTKIQANDKASQELNRQINSQITKIKTEIAQELTDLKDLQNKKTKQNYDSLVGSISQSNKKMENSVKSIKENIEQGLKSERAQTTKQVSKATEQLTSLIGEWSTKIKKERQSGESNLNSLIEGLKKQEQQRNSEDQKKNTDLKTFVEQAIIKINKNIQDQSGKSTKKIQTIKTELETKFQAKLKTRDEKTQADLNSKRQSQIKAKQEENKAKSAEIDRKITESNTKLKTQILNQIAKTSKMSEQVSKKIENITLTLKKQLQTQIQKDKKYCNDEVAKLKAEVEGNLKTRDDKLMGEIQSKKEADLKNKQEETKAKSAEIDKKISESNTKLKTQILSQIAKTSKMSEQVSKKIEGITLNIKKQLQTQIEKDKKYCNDEVAKLKTEIEGSLKIRDDKLMVEIKSKKEADLKTKQEQSKIKSAELDKKLAQISTKIKSDTTVELNKIKTIQTQEIGKLKLQIQAKIKSLEQIKAKKEAESKAKQSQIKKKQMEIQNKSTELDKKLQIATTNLKKDILKTISDEVAKSKTQLDGKLQSYNQANSKKQAEMKSKDAENDKKVQSLLANFKKEYQAESLKDKKTVTDGMAKLNQDLKKYNADTQAKIKATNDLILKSSTQEKAKGDQGIKRIDDLRQQIDKKLLDLKNSLTAATHSKEAETTTKDLNKKIELIKLDIGKVIVDKYEQLAEMIDNLSKNNKESNLTITEVLASLDKTTKDLKDNLNKIQAKAFTQQQKNKAVYEKMSTDILDMADTLTTIVSEMKPQK